MRLPLGAEHTAYERTLQMPDIQNQYPRRNIEFDPDSDRTTLKDRFCDTYISLKKQDFLREKQDLDPNLNEKLDHERCKFFFVHISLFRNKKIRVQQFFPDFCLIFFVSAWPEIWAQAALFFITLTLRALFRARAVSGSRTIFFMTIILHILL